MRLSLTKKEVRVLEFRFIFARSAVLDLVPETHHPPTAEKRDSFFYEAQGVLETQGSCDAGCLDILFSCRDAGSPVTQGGFEMYFSCRDTGGPVKQDTALWYFQNPFLLVNSPFETRTNRNFL